MSYSALYTPNLRKIAAHCRMSVFVKKSKEFQFICDYTFCMVDKDGYRANVGVIVCNHSDEVLWARRCGHDAWQFPQGGIKGHETVEQALFRELWEEVGLREKDVEIIGRTREWLRYEIPKRYLRHSRNRSFRGQKQIWFLLRLMGQDDSVQLDLSKKPEFDQWRWIDYWAPVEHIIEFKREVYRQALSELEPLLRGES